MSRVICGDFFMGFQQWRNFDRMRQLCNVELRHSRFPTFTSLFSMSAPSPQPSGLLDIPGLNQEVVRKLGDLLRPQQNGQGNEANLAQRHDLIQRLWNQLTSANLAPRSDAEREYLAATAQMIRTMYPGALADFADGLNLNPIKRVEKGTRFRLLVSDRITGDTRIRRYEDQEREKTTFMYGNEIKYSQALHPSLISRLIEGRNPYRPLVNRTLTDQSLNSDSYLT
jgi:hypothetical protein